MKKQKKKIGYLNNTIVTITHCQVIIDHNALQMFYQATLQVATTACLDSRVD